ncbi:MAG: ferrous iron transport protein B [Saprospiraceae bacterium]|nr:ferrous iron transport protein B [Saprospiraceae bacterium]
MSTRLNVIALAGNPNSGKTTLFNLLTGSNNKVGNFPGVTVDRVSGTTELPECGKVKIIDLPGAYSLFPNSADERITTEVLIDPHHPDHPDMVIYVADANHLDRQLLAFTQILDLGFPTILVLSLMDEFENAGNLLDLDYLRKQLGVEVVAISSRKRRNIDLLKQTVCKELRGPVKPPRKINELHRDALKMLGDLGQIEEQPNLYMRWLWAHHHDWLQLQSSISEQRWKEVLEKNQFEPLKEQVEETFARLNTLEELVRDAVKKDSKSQTLSEKVDSILTHWLWGPIIFSILMLFVFQAIFAWATYPMDMIETGFGALGHWLRDVLPPSILTDLLTDGILAGLSGVMVFIPQIAILFLLISILEEIGYMARAAYLFDRFLRRFGMNGRSVVALISGGACAIPAIMSTRTIVNWKERLITILVTPFISCSARIPVYTVLIAFVVPYKPVWGVFNSQGLAFALLYVLGIGAALFSGWVFKKVLRARMQSFFVMELPTYRSPDWRSVWRNIRTKVGAFITEAGKIILLISIILWFLASFGPPKKIEAARMEALQDAQASGMTDQERDNLLAAKTLEASFAGILGRSIEPVIRPLGYDWKIGIALISAFAAREVFVGSMATIYSIGSEEDEFRIREHLAKQVDPVTGKPIFNYATALSLLIFFVFAMQCMSTLAVVKKETQSWKWPAVQFIGMTGIAYVAALLAYQLA